MLKGWIAGVVCLLIVAGIAFGRSPRSRVAPPVAASASPTLREVVGPLSAPAINETLFFGGTAWAPDSMRWEALPDSVWTFDTGVGSAIKEPGHTYPGVDPAKPDGFHAYMEGWTGIDFTRTEPPRSAFRRLGSSDPRWGVDGPCVGSAGGLGGDYSLWAGLLPDEADSLCYLAGRGYGNEWNACVARKFAVAGNQAVTLEYDYRNETEDDFDFSRVTVESQAGITEVASYTGTVSGHETLTLTPGAELVSVPDTVRISFCVMSDGAYSDEDGQYSTTCGALALDNIALSGGISDTTDFESDDGGWQMVPLESAPGRGGEWSRLMAVSDLPALDPGTIGTCALGDSVMVFYDPATEGHPDFQDNAAVSPWIDLKRAGAVGYPAYVASIGGYDELPIANFIVLSLRMQWYPYQECPTSPVGFSPWISSGFLYHFTSTPICPDGYYLPGALGALGVPPEAEGIRFALGVVNLCAFEFNCSGISNTTPWIDNVRFGVRTANTLQSLIDAAAEGDTVWVPPGTYSGTGNRDLNFHGKEIVFAGVGGAEATLIDCQNVARGFVFQSGEDSSVVVQGITVRNGLALGNGDGGGVIVTGTSRATIRDCVIEGCEAVNGGGVAVDADGSSIDLISCRLAGNTAQNGGGVSLASGTLEGCMIFGNLATAGGGGVRIRSGGTLVGCSNSTIAGNHAADGGGLYLATGAQLELAATILWGNGADTHGAGAYLQGTNVLKLTCCDSDPAELYGSGSVQYLGSQVYANPVFCGALAWPSAPTTDGVYSLAANSPCLAANNACGVLIGAEDQGCATTGVGDDLAGVKPRVLGAYPNPFSGSLHLSISGPEDAATATVEVFDVRGRLVWRLDLPGSSGKVDWNGLDISGHPAAPGVYFVHVRSGEAKQSARVVRLR